jgi:dephospho-CoA kinase
MAIVGFCGLISAGKDTAANYLCDYHGYRRDSFANTLKDAVANVFGWDRILLEGRTTEAREWREQVDTWWQSV